MFKFEKFFYVCFNCVAVPVILPVDSDPQVGVVDDGGGMGKLQFLAVHLCVVQ